MCKRDLEENFSMSSGSSHFSLPDFSSAASSQFGDGGCRDLSGTIPLLQPDTLSRSSGSNRFSLPDFSSAASSSLGDQNSESRFADNLLPSKEAGDIFGSWKFNCDVEGQNRMPHMNSLSQASQGDSFGDYFSEGIHINRNSRWSGLNLISPGDETVDDSMISWEPDEFSDDGNYFVV
jgi:hypothetical protein